MAEYLAQGLPERRAPRRRWDRHRPILPAARHGGDVDRPGRTCAARRQSAGGVRDRALAARQAPHLVRRCGRRRNERRRPGARPLRNRGRRRPPGRPSSAVACLGCRRPTTCARSGRACATSCSMGRLNLVGTPAATTPRRYLVPWLAERADPRGEPMADAERQGDEGRGQARPLQEDRKQPPPVLHGLRSPALFVGASAVWSHR